MFKIFNLESLVVKKCALNFIFKCIAFFLLILIIFPSNILFYGSFIKIFFSFFSNEFLKVKEYCQLNLICINSETAKWEYNELFLRNKRNNFVKEKITKFEIEPYFNEVKKIESKNISFLDKYISILKGLSKNVEINIISEGENLSYNKKDRENDFNNSGIDLKKDDETTKVIKIILVLLNQLVERLNKRLYKTDFVEILREKEKLFNSEIGVSKRFDDRAKITILLQTLSGEYYKSRLKCNEDTKLLVKSNKIETSKKVKVTPFYLVLIKNKSIIFNINDLSKRLKFLFYIFYIRELFCA